MEDDDAVAGWGDAGPFSTTRGSSHAGASPGAQTMDAGRAHEAAAGAAAGEGSEAGDARAALVFTTCLR
jgi:hypothetical protein